MNKIIAASVLSVKNKKEIINNLIKKNINWIHYDVMDGKFVDNISLSVNELLDIIANTNDHIKDVHLMVKNPLEIIDQIFDKVDYISFHAESVTFEEMEYIVKKHCKNVKLGIALNPSTSVSYIKNLLDKLSYVLIMSVEAGRGGQSYIKNVEEKIKFLSKKNILIQVDGGLNDFSIPSAFEAGANVLVSGSYLIQRFENEDIIGKFIK